MAIKHGRERYRRGCRCDECKQAQASYQRAFRERQRNGLVGVTNATPDLDGPVGNPTPGPVEQAVESELAGVPSAEWRPSLVQVALAMARILDNPRAPSAQPAAAKVLVSVMDQLHKGSAQGRRGSLAVVKSMTQKDGA
jgi:hypothetical protein